MSKRFKTQDYFRYPRLGRKWRRPKGRQSKLRKRKGGSGLRPSIGYGTKLSERNRISGMRFALARSLKDLDGAKEAIIISSSLGARKTKALADRAKELNLRVLNMKKVRKSEKRASAIKDRKEKREKKEKKAAQPQGEAAQTKKDEQKFPAAAEQEGGSE